MEMAALLPAKLRLMGYVLQLLNNLFQFVIYYAEMALLIQMKDVRTTILTLQMAVTIAKLYRVGFVPPRMELLQIVVLLDFLLTIYVIHVMKDA
jgi:hypothetical protein